MLHYLALAVLGPVFAYQGIHVRKNTPKLPEADGVRHGALGEGLPLSLLILGDSAAAGVGVKRQELALSGALSRELATDFAVNWRLSAKSGHTTGDCIQALAQQRDLVDYDVVLLSIGVNDVIQENSRRKWLTQIQQLLALIEDQSGAKLIIVTKIPPMGKFPALPQPLRWFMGYKADWFNQGLARWLKQRNSHLTRGLDGEQASKASHYDLLEIAEVMDKNSLTSLMASDGFHPGEKIYQRWAEAGAASVVDYFKRKNKG